MSDYLKTKARAQEFQAHKEAEIKREIAAKKEKDAAAAKEAEARRKRLDEAAAQARRTELMLANAALTNLPTAGSSRTVEYNPFAEDEFAPSSLAGPSQPRNKLAPGGGKLGNGNGAGRASSQKTGSSGGGSKGKDKKEKERDTTPPLLSRKEKAARAFAQQLKKQGNGGLASIRSLVETDERGGSSSPAPVPRPNSNHRPLPSLPPIPKKLVGSGKKGGDVGDLRKLAPGRAGWDRRSIDEIARDLRANRTKPEPMGRTKSSEGVNPPIGRTGTKRPRSISPRPTLKPKSKPPPIPSSARPVPTQAKRRPRSPSSSSSSSPGPSRVDLDPDDMAGVSATIQALFRRPGGAAPRAKYAASDVSSGSDMEAGLSDVEEEERRAARIARREDELAEKEERERKEKKERMQRAR